MKGGGIKLVQASHAPLRLRKFPAVLASIPSLGTLAARVHKASLKRLQCRQVSRFHKYQQFASIVILSINPPIFLTRFHIQSTHRRAAMSFFALLTASSSIFTREISSLALVDSLTRTLQAVRVNLNFTVIYLYRTSCSSSTVNTFKSSPRTAEIVPLTETSTILEILFQFVYPQRHPSLDDMNWATFAGLAEAAEKYEVYNAMNVCQIRMR